MGSVATWHAFTGGPAFVWPTPGAGAQQGAHNEALLSGHLHSSARYRSKTQLFQKTKCWSRCCPSHYSFRLRTLQIATAESNSPLRNGETETHRGRVMFKARGWHRGIHSLNKCCCSLAKSRPTLFDPMDCSMPGSPVLHYLLEFVQIHVH